MCMWSCEWHHLPLVHLYIPSYQVQILSSNAVTTHWHSHNLRSRVAFPFQCDKPSWLNVCIKADYTSRVTLLKWKDCMHGGLVPMLLSLVSDSFWENCHLYTCTYICTYLASYTYRIMSSTKRLQDMCTVWACLRYCISKIAKLLPAPLKPWLQEPSSGQELTNKCTNFIYVEWYQYRFHAKNNCHDKRSAKKKQS